MARIKGTANSETLLGTLSGTNTADSIYGYAGNDTLNGRDGNDILDGGAGNDTLTGGTGNDRGYGFSGNDTINGDAGNDVLDGGYGDDIMSGGDDNDLVFGNVGNDVVSGNAGNDTVTGGYGNDTVSGGDGDDLLISGNGVDVVDGGANTLVTTNFLTTFFTGGDTLSYADALTGIGFDLDASGLGTGSALTDTWTGIEHVIGSKFKDTLFASDTINGRIAGGAGNDTITAGTADELMLGDEGSDILVGLAGDVDYFGVQNNRGLDRYENFVSGSDKLVVEKLYSTLNTDGFNLGLSTAGSTSLNAAELLNSVDNVALTASQRFIYETDTHILWADLDGSGTVYDSVAIAVIDDVSSLSVTDFIVIA
jgi:Ca2+-binding RTX toxin-like protein